MSYYDVDAILTDAEIDVPGLGYLDQNPAHDLKAGTRLQLPLWLAEMLALANSGAADATPFLTLSLPPALRKEVVQGLKADARAVPLRDQSAHFYALATRMLDLIEDAELATVLRNSFVARTADVALHARKAGGTDTSNTAPSGHTSHDTDRKDDPGNTSSNIGIGHQGQEFLRALDEWERHVFRQTHEGAKAAREFVDNVKRNY